MVFHMSGDAMKLTASGWLLLNARQGVGLKVHELFVGNSEASRRRLTPSRHPWPVP